MSGETEHTPGPWAWMGGPHGLYLATTHSGRRYVMGFRRMGLQAAQPAFRIGERMVPSSDLVQFEVGDGTARGFGAGKADSSVYRYDVSGIDAADARLIAAAPALLEALHEGRRAIGHHSAPNDCYATGPITGDAFREMVEFPACAFIAKFEAVVALATRGAQ